MSKQLNSGRDEIGEETELNIVYMEKERWEEQRAEIDGIILYIIKTSLCLYTSVGTSQQELVYSPWNKHENFIDHSKR